MEAIQYKGLDLVSDEQRVVLDKLSAEYYDKIQRSVHNKTFSLVIHVKKYEDKAGGEGKEKKHAKFSVHVRAIAPSKLFEASAADWDFARTLHKVFREVELVVQHHFKQ
ncbi:hypothetical protein HY639_05855 [Candidatus Woesearchaeota archaeon]|nr:hypothetical protein [Candidatus Woesearchaeota archaeon]